MNRSATRPDARKKPLSGRRVLFYLLLFFGVVFGANGIMVKLAVDSMPGAEVDSAYRASLRFNSEIAAARAQAERKWRVNANVARAPDGGTDLRVEARDAEGAPVTGLQIAVRFDRPTTTREDHRIVLSERESGIYRGKASYIVSGQWDLVIEAERGERRLYRSRNRIVLQ
jgi:nitrogen fixation protein FixH